MNAPSTSLALARTDVATTEVTRHAPPPEASFPALVKMGDDLVRTGFLPEHIRNGAQAAAIILTGRELGMEQMRSLRSLHIVKGKVVEDAASQLSRFKADGGHGKFLHLDETKAVLWLRHPNGDEHTETFTIADAKAANLSTDNWRKYPKAMLRSRVITAGLKSLGWEGGVGVYDPDEAANFTTKHEAPPPAEHVVERTVVMDAGVQLADTQKAARVELDRLKVGENMTKDEAAEVRKAMVARVNGGKIPKTLEEWTSVLAGLRAEPTPTIEESSVPEEAPAEG